MRPRTMLPVLLACATVVTALVLHARATNAAAEPQAPSPMVAPPPAAASDCDAPEPVKPVSFGTCS